MRRALRTLTIWSFLWFTALLSAFSACAQETEADQEAVEVENDDLINAVVDEMIAADDLEILLVPLTAEELSQVAGTWQSYVRSRLEEVAQVNLQLRSASGTREDNLRSQLSSMNDSGSETLNNYRLVLEAWALKGAKAEDLEPHSD